jgi:hypothetical protein
MAFLSLLPAVGSALIWFPAALYLLATGAVWQGLLLIAYGVLVIGLVDNFLRPLLLGMDTNLPEYVVLVSTLGGLALFGLNGFVIGPRHRRDVYRHLGYFLDANPGFQKGQRPLVSLPAKGFEIVLVHLGKSSTSRKCGPTFEGRLRFCSGLGEPSVYEFKP